jgi:prophage antirepressor-like protein
MEYNKLENRELGLNLSFFKGKNKPERVFVASQIMKQLGYKGGNKVLSHYELIEGVDKVTLRKIDWPVFFKRLGKLNLLGSRAGSVIMLYESGVWKLVMNSKKPIGIKTRNWLAREVLPSIRRTGKYDVEQSQNNPFSYLHDFTEHKKQLENSKKVAEKAKINRLSYSDTYNAIHKLVMNKTAKEINEMFNTKGSAREALRKHLPEYAATEAVIDEIFTNYNKSLNEIQASGATKTLPPAFLSLYKLGIKF